MKSFCLSPDQPRPLHGSSGWRSENLYCRWLSWILLHHRILLQGGQNPSENTNWMLLKGATKSITTQCFIQCQVCHDYAMLEDINLFSQVIKRNDTHLTKKFRSAISSYVYIVCVLHVQYTITHVYHTSYVRGKTQTNTQLHFVFNNRTQYKICCLR